MAEADELLKAEEKQPGVSSHSGEVQRVARAAPCRGCWVIPGSVLPSQLAGSPPGSRQHPQRPDSLPQEQALPPGWDQEGLSSLLPIRAGNRQLLTGQMLQPQHKVTHVGKGSQGDQCCLSAAHDISQRCFLPWLPSPLKTTLWSHREVLHFSPQAKPTSTQLLTCSV